jgi:tetratricopeptide (TPR) repeat protein
MIKRTLSLAFAALLSAGICSAAGDKEAYLHFMNGMVQERKGNFDDAMQEYRRTLLLDPESVYVYKQALNLALRVGKVEDAAQWAEFVVKSDSATADNWVLYGNVRWAKGDLEGARGAYEKAVALDPSAHEAFYQLASLWSAKAPEKSVDYLKKYLELRPEDAAEIYYQIAVLYNMKGNGAETKKNLLLSKAADPYYPQPRYLLGEYYEVNNDTAAALAEYEELAELEPGNKALYDHLGTIYTSPAALNLPLAEKYFLKTYGLDKSDPAACYWLSIIAEQRRDFKAAAGYLEGSSALKDDADVTLRLAYYYTQSGRYEQAITMLEAASKKWPDNLEMAYFLALGYDDTGRTPKARELLKSIIAKAPANAEARMQYAVISERVGDMPAAEENFRALLQLNPANANVLNYLGYSLADRGQKLDEAELLISSAVALEPGNGAYLDSLAWVRFRLGRLPEAQAAIEKALSKVYDDPIVWAHAGAIREAAGDAEGAWLAWRKSEMLDKPEKRKAAAARLRALEKKIPAERAGALRRAHMKAFLPAGQEFSSFAKVEGKLRGKTVKFDAILHFSPPEDFTITVMGPLMAPLWKARLTGEGMEMDSVSLAGLDPDAFSYWASLMAGELRDWFSGRTAQAGSFDGDWGEDCFKGGGREVCLGDGGLPEEIRPDAEKKLVFEPQHYFFKNLYLFPYKMAFELPGVALTITLDNGQMNFEALNTLGLAAEKGDGKN